MGICSTKTKDQASTSSNKEIKEQNQKTELKAKTDLLNSRFSKTQPNQDIYPQYSHEYQLSIRSQTRPNKKKTTGQYSLSSRSLYGQMFETNASKKYSLIKRRLAQNDISLMQNNRTGRLVEMETLPKKSPLSLKYIEWLQKINLDHPHINRMIEIHQDLTSYQIIYEHFSENYLSDLIAGEKKLLKPLVASILEQIMLAVTYLHSLNVIHGNLTMDSFCYEKKPDGIVVKLNNLKSIFIKDEENIDVKIHTPPQLIYNSKVYNISRDVWAIGIIGLTLRRGKLPYNVERTMPLDKVQWEINETEFNFDNKKDIVYREFLKQILNKDRSQIKGLTWFLQHRFIENHKVQKNKSQLHLLSNILVAKPCCLLQELIINFFVSEFNWEEYQQIQKLFNEGDMDKNGSLSKEELLSLFKSHFDESENFQQKIDQLYNHLEMDKNMKLTSSKFYALAASRHELITKHNIEVCFGIFSNDTPEISLRGLRRHLNYQKDDLFDEFTHLTDSDKTLNLAQFTKLMEILL